MQRLALAALVFLFLPACAHNFDYYLTDARIGDNTQSLLEGHHIEPGKDTVLLIRNWSPGSLLAIDDEVYEKLSLQLPEVRRGLHYDINQPGVRYSYSEGASAWVHRRGGAYAYGAEGSIDIIEVTAQDITARLDLTFHLYNMFREERSTRPVHLTGLHTFTRIGHDQLTPWIGAAGEYPGQEAYPRCRTCKKVRPLP
jgi:hypothetical protein